MLDKEDNKWVDCWEHIELKNGTSEPPIEACYKSTLIIPMTLLGNDLDVKFKKHFKIDNEAERAVWGYLCFDHQSLNYFDGSVDEHHGYIYADILSLYLITELTYSKHSRTCSKALKYLNN